MVMTVVVMVVMVLLMMIIGCLASLALKMKSLSVFLEGSPMIVATIGRRLMISLLAPMYTCLIYPLRIVFDIPPPHRQS